MAASDGRSRGVSSSHRRPGGVSSRDRRPRGVSASHRGSSSDLPNDRGDGGDFGTGRANRRSSANRRQPLLGITTRSLAPFDQRRKIPAHFDGDNEDRKSVV